MSPHPVSNKHLFPGFDINSADWNTTAQKHHSALKLNMQVPHTSGKKLLTRVHGNKIFWCWSSWTSANPQKWECHRWNGATEIAKNHSLSMPAQFWEFCSAKSHQRRGWKELLPQCGVHWGCRQYSSDSLSTLTYLSLWHVTAPIK